MFYNQHMPTLSDALVHQIETAVERLRDEGGHGELALVMVNGELQQYVERRPRIRMHVARAVAPTGVGPPDRQAIAGCRTTTG